MDSCVSGFGILAFWILGFVDLWTSTILDLCVWGFLLSWISGFVGFWDFCNSGFCNFLVSGFLGFVDFLVFAILDVWISEF